MKVSIIIPCHNVEAHLARALDSALAQDHEECEIICVDDGSTDGTAEMLMDYARRHEGRVQVLRQENKGASAARNRGMQESSGEYLQFLDADDMISPQKISSQVKLATGLALPDLIVGDYESVMPDGLLLPIEAVKGQAWMGLIRTRLGCTCSNLWRRAAVMEAGGWPEKLGSSQDYTLMFRMLRNNCSVTWDREIQTIIFKREAGSISQTGLFANWERYVALRWEIKKYLETLDPVRYRKEITILDQYIFMALRILAKYDQAAALRYWRAILPRGFVPEVSRAITERYVVLYKLLGFAGAEGSIRLLRGRARAIR